MATFDQNITAIKQAQYGYEVRDAIAEALTQSYEKASSIVCLTYTETELSSGGKMIDIPIPNGKTVRIFTKGTPSGYSGSYISVGLGNLTASYYATFTDNPTYTITKNQNDGSIFINLSETKSELTRTIGIKVGYDAIEVSVLIASSDESVAGLGTFTEIILQRVAYSSGYSATGTYYPGILDNPKYIPLVMTDFGGPGECLTVSSGVKTTFNGKVLFRDLSVGGRVGCHFYTRFVYKK